MGTNPNIEQSIPVIPERRGMVGTGSRLNEPESFSRREIVTGTGTREASEDLEKQKLKRNLREDPDKPKTEEYED